MQYVVWLLAWKRGGVPLENFWKISCPCMQSGATYATVWSKICVTNLRIFRAMSQRPSKYATGTGDRQRSPAGVQGSPLACSLKYLQLWCVHTCNWKLHHQRYCQVAFEIADIGPILATVGIMLCRQLKTGVNISPTLLQLTIVISCIASISPTFIGSNFWLLYI